MDRRQFIKSGAAAALTASLLQTRVSFANFVSDNRVVVMILRGGMDGLHALVPYTDTHYRNLRPKLALSPEDTNRSALDLDGYFAMHSALGPLMPLYRDAELLFVPAASTSYKRRSHFDGQNILENGADKPFAVKDGWLNRVVSGLDRSDRRLGLALGSSVPFILHGDTPVQTWSKTSLPEVDGDFLNFLTHVYQSDPEFLKNLMQAQQAIEPSMDMSAMKGNLQKNRNFAASASVAADLLSQETGPRLAVMEMQGWDTHFAQERRLRQLFGQLSEGILALKYGLGAHWSKTVIVVVSEFGRTAAENGSGGTDHGSGGLAIVAGGAVSGGKIAGDWPGLAASGLYEGRDVNAVNDYRGIFKSILKNHLRMDSGYIDEVVFPSSGLIRPMTGLIRQG